MPCPTLARPWNAIGKGPIGKGLALSIALLLCSCRMDPSDEQQTSTASDRVGIGDIQWYVDYEAAVAVAAAEDKPLWVHFGENPG